ncbi:unnamed protein product [Callosobruchus maculatus]|uniref:AMP-dependent synthetase/ligase domain-containing protein n=1 Tax=Callosobruchus maculatus TaxID=64391 RepID=A0A653BFU4_CALMS|nr:unnamed protein product [Callosobruchus maculatus]
MASRPPRRKSLSGSIDIEGSRVSYEIYNGGLGKRYFDKLGQDLDQIIQVDVSTGVTETRGSVRGRAVKLAIEMKQRGIKHDDIIVMCSRTNTDQVIVVLAALFIGANLAPLDPEFNYKEVLDLMKQLKPKLCFGDSRTIPQFDRIFQALNMNITTVNFNPDQAGTVQFRKLLLAHKEDEKFTPIFVEAPRTEVAFILPTQGTTGLPKLICLSHENIFVQTVILLEILGQPDKVISFFPISWFFQMILVCLTFERPVTRIIPVMFTERNACKIIHDFSIRHAILGTDYAMKMANSPALRDYNLNCLRVVMIGTVNTMKHDVQTLRQLMPHVKFLQCYCLTETGCIAATRLSSYSKSMFKQGGIGPLTMNCRVRIVDTETRKGVGPNSYGELLYTGDGLMLGFIADRCPERQRPTKIIYMEHFPRTSIGNVLKRILRRDLLEMKIHYTSSIASIETTAVRRSTSVERPSVSSSFVSLDSRRDTSYSETSFKNERFISDVLSSNMLRTVFGNYVYDEMLEEHINENTQ